MKKKEYLITVANPLADGGRTSLIILLEIGNAVAAIIPVTDLNTVKLIMFDVPPVSNKNIAANAELKTNNHFLVNLCIFHK